MIKLLRNCNLYSTIFVFLLAITMVAPVSSFAQYSESNSKDKTITVYGKGTITVKPDVVYFPMDISTTAPIIDDAYEENLIKVENTIKKLKKLGIKREWIKVMDAQLFKIESYNAGESAIFGVSNILVITIHGVDKMKPEELRKKIFSISQAVSRTTVTPYAATSSPGAGRISNELSKSIGYYGHYPVAVFGLTKYEDLDDKILLEAIEDAKKEAERFAKVLGVKLKEMIYFYQSFPYDKSCATTGYENEILPEGPKSSNPKSIKLCATVNIIYTFE